MDVQPRTKEGRFKKGNTAAAGSSRPKKDPDLATQCRKLTTLCVQNLAGILMDAKAHNRDKLSAAALVLAYGSGRPRITADVNVEYSITDQFLASLKLINERASDVTVPKDINIIEAKPVAHDIARVDTDGKIVEAKVFKSGKRTH